MGDAVVDQALEQRKSELRERMRAVRDAVEGPARPEHAEAVAARLADVAAFGDAGAIGFYYSSGSEVMTPALIQRVVEEEGRRAFLPFVLNGELQMSEWRPSDPVVVAPYVGFHPRFRRAVDLAEVEVIVLPGLAFDRAGRRLGSGEGMYDRLLARMSPATVRIGIGFEVQLVDEVPAGPNDVTVDVVVTEAGVVECPRAAAAA